MVLFADAHCTIDEAERILGRPLDGTPSDGEIAILQSLNGDRFRDVREALQDRLDPAFRDLIQERLLRGVSRGASHVTLRVRIPIRVLAHYERLANRLNLSLSECLEAAVLRDHAAQEDGNRAAEQLGEAVANYHRAVGKLTQDLRDVLERAGNVADITMRLGRLEGVMASIANRLR